MLIPDNDQDKTETGPKRAHWGIKGKGKGDGKLSVFPLFQIISGLQREEIVFYEEQGGEDSEEGDDLETELFAASAHQQTDHSKDGYEAIAPGPNIRGAYNTLVAGDEEFDISDQEDEREGEREGEGKEEGKGDLGSISLDTPVAVLDNRTASVTPVADEEFDVDDGEKDEDQVMSCGQQKRPHTCLGCPCSRFT